jgi:hypothetical protein
MTDAAVNRFLQIAVVAVLIATAFFVGLTFDEGIATALKVALLFIGWFVLIHFLENLGFDSHLNKWAKQQKLCITQKKRYFEMGRKRIYDVTLEDCNGSNKNARVRIYQPFMKLRYEVQVVWDD